MFAFAVHSRDFRLSLSLAIALFLLLWPAAGWAYTAEQQQACSDDAFRLCSAEIPDVDRVTACMVRQQSELSPGCRVFFRPDPPVTPVETGKPLSITPAHTAKTAQTEEIQLDHDPMRLNRIMISSLCLGMIFSKNRFPLFRIMLQRSPPERWRPRVFAGSDLFCSRHRRPPFAKTGRCRCAHR